MPRSPRRLTIRTARRPDRSVLLVVVGVREVDDVRRRSETYAATAAGLDPAEVPALRSAASWRLGHSPAPDPARAPGQKCQRCTADRVRAPGRARRRAPQHLHAAVLGTVDGMKRETPRSPDGAKLCAWCAESIRQSGVGRSRDYCKRLCREQAYRKRRDERLIQKALADAQAVSSTGETTARKRAPVSPVDETASVQAGRPIPAPARLTLPDAWRAPAQLPVRRTLSRPRLLPPPPGFERDGMLPFGDADSDDGGG